MPIFEYIYECKPCCRANFSEEIFISKLYQIECELNIWNHLKNNS